MGYKMKHSDILILEWNLVTIISSKESLLAKESPKTKEDKGNFCNASFVI